MNQALPLSVAVPLLAAALTLVCGPRTRRAVLYGTLGSLALFHAALTAAVADGSVLAVHIGGQPGGIAVTFAVDAFSGLMLTATAVLLLLCAVFAAGTGDARRPAFTPLLLVLTAGVSGALITTDLFNLFVFIEVAMLPSYVLVMASDEPRRRAAAGVYVTTGLLASTVFLAGAALVYGSAGTTNLAALAGAQVRAPIAVVLIALAVKSALAPFHGWIAQSYPFASPAVAALFAVIHTKLALYAIYRVYTLVLDGDPAYAAVAAAVCLLAVLVGAVAALGTNRIRTVLSFGMVSTNGAVALGAVLAMPAGLAAGIFYLVNAMVIKGALFMAAGAIEHVHPRGADLTGVARSRPVLAVAFIVPALSLAGMPPFSGFVAKYALVRAAFDADRPVAAVVVIAASLILLAAVVALWQRRFVAEPGTEPDVERPGAALTAPALILAGATVVLGLGGGWLLDLCDTAARGLADPARYMEAVLG